METNENKKPKNPNAFPNTTVNADGVICGKIQKGMTLRDYFANSAMQGLINKVKPSEISTNINPEWIAESAYRIADAMLKQRELNNN